MTVDDRDNLKGYLKFIFSLKTTKRCPKSYEKVLRNISQNVNYDNGHNKNNWGNNDDTSSAVKY